jgi:thiol-disulfide isomerase/thioredoxin
MPSTETPAGYQRFAPILLLALAAASAGAAVHLLLRGDRTRWHAEQKPAINFSLPAVDGATLDLATLRGQPIVLNFWASWCGPCVREAPLLERFHQQQQGKIRVIGVAIDERTAAQEFAKRKNLSFPNMVGEFNASEALVAYGNRSMALPYTVVINRDFQIVKTKLGELKAHDLEQIAEELN